MMVAREAVDKVQVCDAPVAFGLSAVDDGEQL
jgi:hypothetical protein